MDPRYVPTDQFSQSNNGLYTAALGVSSSIHKIHNVDEQAADKKKSKKKGGKD